MEKNPPHNHNTVYRIDISGAAFKTARQPSKDYSVGIFACYPMMALWQ